MTFLKHLHSSGGLNVAYQNTYRQSSCMMNVGRKRYNVVVVVFQEQASRELTRSMTRTQYSLTSSHDEVDSAYEVGTDALYYQVTVRYLL